MGIKDILLDLLSKNLFIMKHMILVVLLFILTINVYPQKFIAPSRSNNKFTDTTTTYTYKCPEKTYKVYVSKRGAYYIWKISKRTNRLYKYYLPKQIQINMGRKYEQK